MLLELAYLAVATFVLLNTVPTMASNYSQELEKLGNISHNLESWKSTSIPIIVATSLNNDDPLQINLSETIGHSRRCHPKYRTDENVYWLLSKYNQNTPKFRSNVINALVYQWCKAAGFRVTGSWEGW